MNWLGILTRELDKARPAWLKKYNYIEGA